MMWLVLPLINSCQINYCQISSATVFVNTVMFLLWVSSLFSHLSNTVCCWQAEGLSVPKSKVLLWQKLQNRNIYQLTCFFLIEKRVYKKQPWQMHFPQNTKDKTPQFTKIICLGLTSCQFSFWYKASIQWSNRKLLCSWGAVQCPSHSAGPI